MSGGGSFHKKDWLKVGAALAATVATAGMAAPLMGAGAAGAGAIGAGAGALAPGAALAGGGMAGLGGGTAALFGPSAAGAGLLSGLGGTAALAPELAAMGAGTAGMFGPAAGSLGAGLLGSAGAAAPAIGGSLGTAAGPGILSQLQGFAGSPKFKTAVDAMQKAQQQTGQEQQKPPMEFGPAPQQNAQPIVGGAPGAEPPPSTPFSAYDPVWQDYLKRHPELRSIYGV